MKRILLRVAGAAILPVMMLASCGTFKKAPAPAIEVSSVSEENASVVYFTKDISPEGLVKLYEALGVEAKGRVAVKISTGESEKSNHLRPEFIAPLVQKVNGNIVECNTAYKGNRSSTDAHRKEIAKRGYDKIATVDIMDEEGEIKIPVADDRWIKYDIVGSHIQDYDFMINLAHFKGHAMGGFGGVLKNASIGVGSQNGKAYIHSAGKTEDWHKLWTNLPKGWMSSPENNTPFIESMSAASLDPVALDKFCLDQVFTLPNDENNDTKALLERISQRHGTRIVYRAEETGLGSTKYTVVDIDKK